MKFLLNIIILLVGVQLLSCKAQRVPPSLPRIENYAKGELDIVVLPFGMENPIYVGKILADGSISFNWDTKIDNIKAKEFFMSSVENALSISLCNSKEPAQIKNQPKLATVSGLVLYKNGRLVGSLFPATKDKIRDNGGSNRRTSLVLGSFISYYYSDGDIQFKTECTQNLKYGDLYDFLEVTSYNVHFKEGWNMVLNTLSEKEDWNYEESSGSLPKTLSKISITQIPENIEWFAHYTGE